MAPRNRGASSTCLHTQAAADGFLGGTPRGIMPAPAEGGRRGSGGVNDDEQIIRDFLGEQPESRQLRVWRGALYQRLRALRAELDRLPTDERSQIERQIRRLRTQIRALDEEEAITRYVEDSVRVTLAMGAVITEAGDPLLHDE